MRQCLLFCLKAVDNKQACSCLEELECVSPVIPVTEVNKHLTTVCGYCAGEGENSAKEGTPPVPASLRGGLQIW